TEIKLHFHAPIPCAATTEEFNMIRSKQWFHWKNWFTGKALRSAAVRRAFRPRLEELEDRIAPAAPVIPLNNFGNQGATLRGFEDHAGAGRSVAGAGDVNGDGFADLIIGAPRTNAGGSRRGEAYVVFGGSNLGGTTVTLNALGTGGFTLSGFEDSAYAGNSVA